MFRPLPARRADTTTTIAISGRDWGEKATRSPSRARSGAFRSPAASAVARALLALTIVGSIQTVGIGLVAAMLVTPGATAYLLTRRLAPMMAISAALGVAASVIGLYLSYYLNIVSGSAIVLVATAFFLMAFFFAPQKGWVWQRLHVQRR